MAEHYPGPAGQIWYPGGKNNWWRVNCSQQDYTAVLATPEASRKRVLQHCEAKNG